MELLTETFDQIPRITLGTLPTPLHTMPNLAKKLGVGPIYMKRDDMTGVGPGGNKVRSLEFILGEVVAQQYDVVLVAGPIQSNLCTLTAACCAKLGLRCILVHNGNEPEHKVGNQMLNQLMGCEVHYVNSTLEKDRTHYIEQLFHTLTGEGKHPYIVKNGASTGVGALGYVQAAVELLAQCKEQSLELKTIFIPGGNGGVAAGLVYGNAMLGSPFQIKVISVEYSRDILIEKMQYIANEIGYLLKMPLAKPIVALCEIDDRYSGGGWGKDTAESRAWVARLPNIEGIFIENVYNSKVLVGMIDYLKKSKSTGGSCYLHTGGFGSLFSQY